MTDKLFLITEAQVKEFSSFAEAEGITGFDKLLQALPMVTDEPVGELLLSRSGHGIVVEWHKTVPVGAKLYKSPQALTKLPEPIFTKVADGIELGHNLWGGIAIRLGGEFTYVQVNYNHEYTDNATRARLADNIVKLIQGEAPAQQVLAPITADDVTDEMVKEIFPTSATAFSRKSGTYKKITRDIANIYNAVIKGLAK